jgi:hypothetical protein
MELDPQVFSPRELGWYKAPNTVWLKLAPEKANKYYELGTVNWEVNNFIHILQIKTPESNRTAFLNPIQVFFCLVHRSSTVSTFKDGHPRGANPAA